MGNRPVTFYIVAFLFLLFLGYANLQVLHGFYTDPDRVQAAIQEHVGPGVHISGSSIHLNDGLRLTDVRVSVPDNEMPEAGSSGANRDRRPLLMSVPEINIWPNLSALLRGRLQLERVSVRSPEFYLREYEQGQWNVKEFISSLPERPDTPDSEILDAELVLDKGSLTLDSPFILAENRLLEVHDLGLRFTVRDGGRYVAVDGQGRAEHIGSVNLQGSLSQGGFQLNLSSRRLNFDEQLPSQFSSKLQEEWQKYRFTGPVDLELRIFSENLEDLQVARPGSNAEGEGPAILEENGDVSQKLIIEPRGMQGTYDEFPYPVKNVHGRVELYPDRIELDQLRARMEETVVRLSGMLHGYGPHQKLDLQLDARRVPVDERLLSALDPPEREAVKDLNPEGTFDISGRIFREQGGPRKAHVDFRVQPRGMDMSYEKAPYPFTDVTGMASIETGQITLDRLNGVPVPGKKAELDSEATITGSLDTGTREQDEVQSFQLNISGQNIPLDQHLKNLVPGRGKEVWERLNPGGTTGLDWSMSKSGPDREPQHQIEAAVDRGTLQPESLPVPITNTRIRMDITNDHISVESVEGNWKEGRIKMTDGAFQVGRMESNSADLPPFQIHVEGNEIPVDSDLLSLLFPNPETRRVFQKEGSVSLQGTVRAQQIMEPGQPLTYYGKVFLDGVSLQENIRIQDVDGHIVLSGQTFLQDPDRTQLPTGRIQLEHFYLGNWPIRSTSANLQFREDELVFHDLSGGLFGGEVKERYGNNRKSLLRYHTENNRFFLRFRAADIDLRDLSVQLGLRDRNLRGRLGGRVEMSGNASDPSDWLGTTNIWIRDSTLWQVPLFASVLTNLTLQRPRPFEEGEVDSIIRDKTFHIREMRFLSPDATLYGQGKVGFDSSLRVNVGIQSHRSLLPHIPLFSSVVERVRENFLTYEAGGDFSNPTITPKPLPFLLNLTEEGAQRSREMEEPDPERHYHAGRENQNE